MDAITGFLEDFDFAKLLPEVEKFLSDLRFWIGFLMILGPLVLLGFGLCYYLRPAKEANHRVGYRTYYGMGSTKAWLFTQKLAGTVWTVLGGAMAVVSLLISLICLGANVLGLATTAVVWLVIQVLLTLGSCFVIRAKVRARFDKDGNSIL